MLGGSYFAGSPGYFRPATGRARWVNGEQAAADRTEDRKVSAETLG